MRKITKKKNDIEYMDYRDILKIISDAGSKSKIVKIYYPKTETSTAGWREIEPYSLTTDIGTEGEHLVYGKDRIVPGHIFNGYTVKSEDNHCDSFIIGKIKSAKATNKNFTPRNNWRVEF